MGHLNPRAKTFLRGHSDATTTMTPTPAARASQPNNNQSTMSFPAPLTNAPPMPTASTPTPTPSNSPITSDDSKTPRVAPRFGHNWSTSTFPTTPASAGARTQRFDVNSLLSANDPIAPYSNRSRSPSVPLILPSDEERRVTIPARTNFPGVESSLRSLRHLQLADATPTFNPFGDGASSGSALNTARCDAPLNITHFGASSTVYNATATRNSSPKSCDSGNENILYSNNDSGEIKNVYIPNIPKTVTTEILKDMGSTFGSVVYASVHHDGITMETYEMLPERAKLTRLPECFGFIMFTTVDASRLFTKVISKMWLCQCMPANETHQLKGKAHEDPHSSNLYVAEIPLNCTEHDLHQLMSPGIISSHRFLVDSSGNRRGVAMVRLQSRAQAEAAIARLDRKITMRGCVKPIQVRIADSESQKLHKKNGSGTVSPPLRRAASVAIMQNPAPTAKQTCAQPTSLDSLSSELVYQELSERELQTAVQIGDGARRELHRRESLRALHPRASVPSFASSSARSNFVAFPDMPMTPTTPSIFGASPDPWLLPSTSPTTATTHDVGRWERANTNNKAAAHTPESESELSSSSRAAAWNNRYGATSSSWRN